MAIASLAAIAGPAAGQSIPAPWTATDIGGPALTGSASASSGVLTIDAAGAGMSRTSDQFHFVYRAVAGDVDLRARIDDLAFVDAWSQAGVMIRGSLQPTAAHAYAFVSAGNGVGFGRRRRTGGASRYTLGASEQAPHWVRVVRQGYLVTAYSSATGTTWTHVGSGLISAGATVYVGIAVTSHNTSVRTTAHVSNVTVTKLTLPDGQTSADIGAPAIPGSASYADNAYTVSAAGTGIAGSSDQFHYVYQQVVGDAEVTARIASLYSTNPMARAGVMFRETLASDSRYASALLSSGSGYAFDRRVAPAIPSTSTAVGAGVAPGWVRLVRAGTTFTAYQSADGIGWTTIGSETIDMADAVYVGIAVTSHDAALPAQAVVDGFTVAEIAPPANQPPIVALTAPADAAEYTAPATIDLAASASDPEGRLSAVEFYAGATLLGRVTTPPYSWSWTSVPAGTYGLTATAFDADGKSAASGLVTVTVHPAPNQPPVVSLTAPLDGAQYGEPAVVTLSASASDPDGLVASVLFYAGSTLIGSDATEPYSVSWSPVPAGTYTLTAVAHDADGGSATSAAVSITVNPVMPPPRLAVFTASPDHDTTVTTYLLEVFAEGAIPDIAPPVASVDLGTPTPDSNGDITVDAATFFSALPSGTYVVTVVAIGSAGRSRSAPVSFTR